VFSGGEGMLQATKELGIGRHWLMAARPTGVLRESRLSQWRPIQPMAVGSRLG